MPIFLFIAKRYFVSKKSHHIINVISWISVIGVTVSTAALIIILSAFNGIEGLVKDIYSSFDADITITEKNTKDFIVSDELSTKVKRIEGVTYVSKVIEDNIIARHDDAQVFVTVKGVDSLYFKTTNFLEFVDKNQSLSNFSNGVIVGSEIAYQLGLPPPPNNPVVRLIYPNKSSINSIIPSNKFKQLAARVEGIFYLSPDFDSKYILMPIAQCNEFIDKEGKATSLDVGVNSSYDIAIVAESIANKLGKEYTVKTRYQKNEVLFKTNQIEKWITFLVMFFTLLLASFNIMGTITMLSLDKKQDIKILKAMGADNRLIRKIFFAEGLLITIIGSIIGILIGYLVCLAQVKYKLIRFEGIVEYYPIKFMWIDFFSVVAAVLLVGFFASYFPLRRINISKKL